MPYDVFISYKNGGKDEEIAKQISNGFEGSGISVFRDKYALGLGDDFSDKIREAVLESKICIFVVSKRWAESNFHLLELFTAMQNEVSHTIIPVALDDFKDVQMTVKKNADKHAEYLLSKPRVREFSDKVDVVDLYKRLINKRGKVPSSVSVPSSEVDDLIKEVKAMLNSQSQKPTCRKVLRPFTFESDVKNLLTRFQPGSRGWLFKEIVKWLALGPEESGHRAMVLYGGPGLGKSTVAAALVAQKADGVPESAVVGHWFCRHNDARRSEPVRMIRTFAYQLAEAVPAIKNLLARLTPADVVAWVDPEMAFQHLLKKPLEKVLGELSSRQTQMVLVIDALDEMAVGGDISSAINNPVLRLIREHFPHLPSTVRFIFTSRPEPNIVNSLDAAIHELKIEPGDERNKADLKVLIRDHLAKHLKEGSDLEEAVELVLNKSGGVFVYLARLLEGLEAEKQWSLDKLCAFPNGLHATYTDFLERLPGSSDSKGFAKTDLGRLLAVLLAVQEPPSLELLAAAWNAEPPAADGGMEPAEAKHKVMTLLGQLGSLYSTCDGRVQVFHKSFHDFLESIVVAGAVNRFWVSSSLGLKLLVAAGHSSTVSSVAWSPNGRQLASGSKDNTLRVWDAASGECYATLQPLRPGADDPHVCLPAGGGRTCNAAAPGPMDCRGCGCMGGSGDGL